MNIEKGTYQIIFELKDNLSLPVGALGFFVLPAGRYIYTGKANRQLIPTIRKIVTPYTRTRLHMDYLSSRDEFVVNRILVYPEILDPCMINELTVRYSKGHPYIPNFGTQAEDRCLSHLLLVVEDPENVLQKLIKAFGAIMIEPGDLYA